MSTPLSPSIAVQAALRGDEQPLRVDSISVGLSHGVNSISENLRPPPIPNTPRPKQQPLLSHAHTTDNDRDRTSPSPSSSSRSRGHHSHSNRDLPPPPPFSRAKEPAPSPPSKPSTPPLVEGPTSSRGGSQDRGPRVPARPSAPYTRSQGSQKPLPSAPFRQSTSHSTKQSTGGGPLLPSRAQSVSNGGKNFTSGGPQLPPRPTTRSPPLAMTKTPSMDKPEKPERPSRWGSRSQPRPPPAGDRPKPLPPKKPSALMSPTSPIAKSFEKSNERQRARMSSPPSDGVQEGIQVLLTEAPEVLTAVQDRYGTVPQLLEDLATLTENVIEGAQSGPNDSSIKFRRCITNLRSQVGTLRNAKGPSWQNSAGDIEKAISNIIKQVQQLSTHLVG